MLQELTTIIVCSHLLDTLLTDNSPMQCYIKIVPLGSPLKSAQIHFNTKPLHLVNRQRSYEVVKNYPYIHNGQVV